MQTLKLANPSEVRRDQVEGNDALVFALTSAPFIFTLPIPTITGIHRRLIINEPTSTQNLTVQGYDIAPGQGIEFYYYGGVWLNTADGAGASGPSKLTVPQSLTSPALQIPVDYDDPSAVDPDPDTVFETQAQVNDFLAAAGATAFKHIMAVWDAMPEFMNHTVDINLGYGIHRPRPSEPAPAAWFFGAYLNKPKVFGPRFFLRLQEPTIVPASWPTIVAPQIIVTNNLSVSGNPNLVVSGTPYTAGALKGYYAFVGTGTFPAVIHDNTADTLFFLRTPSGSITPGVTTVRVCKPGIILRNSLNDTTQAKSIAFQSDIPSVSGMFANGFTLESFGTNQDMLFRGRADVLQVLIDNAGVKDQFGISNSGIGLSLSQDVNPSIQSQVWDFSYRSSQFAAVPGGGGQAMQVSGIGDLFVSFVSAYLGAGSNPLIIREAMTRFFGNVVVELKGGSSVPGILVEGNSSGGINGGRAVFRGASGSSFKSPEIRTCFSGIDFNRAMAKDFNGNFIFNGLFGGANQAAIIAREDCDLDLSGGTLINGAGVNAGRGVDVVGPNSRVKLSAGTTVSGTLGEARLDTVAKTYAEIAATRRPSSQPGGTLAGIVTVEDVEAGTTIGNGTLTFTATGTTLAFTASGDTIGAAKDVSGLGYFVLRSNNGKWVRVFVAGTLPGGDTAQTFAVARGVMRLAGPSQNNCSLEKL